MEPIRNAPRVLLVDDEEAFRRSLADRLVLRGFDVRQAGDGEEAVRIVRSDAGIEVVVLDWKMPGQGGEKTLEEIKTFRPEIQVVMLTAYSSVESAARVGKLGVFRYLAKPAPMDELTATLRAAAREKIHALARQHMPARPKRGFWSRVRGSANFRPGVLLLGATLLLYAMLAPAPRGLVRLLETPRGDSAAAVTDPVAGYPDYRAMAPGETIARHYVASHRPPGVPAEPGGGATDAIAHRASLMIALILVAAIFWATSAVPIGITALVVAAVMYLGGVMRPDEVAQAFAKDSVVFIFGVLVLSRVIRTTGLDRRIAMLLLVPVRSLPSLLFVFLPVFGLACSFISETILIALMMPLFVTVYREITEGDADRPDRRQLLVLFALMLCYSSNLGGPGSPAAGGRNAVMIGILADYGAAPSFLQWMKYGLPFVPVATLVLAVYFYFVFRWRIPSGDWNVAARARLASERLGPMNREEYATAIVSLLVVALWVFGSDRLGMGGPVLLGLVLLNILGVMKWSEITRIHWDVVFLYAGASALGKGLAVTGGALYLAHGFVDFLPGSLIDGSAFGGVLGPMALPMAVSLVTGLVTNIMSDGATVSALGPIAVPMARNAGLHPWALGFAVAFASSFPHMLIIGTPANALVYILCRDPRTGQQLVRQSDFLKHGAFAFLLSFLVLWGWAMLGYWRWFGL